MYFERIGAGLNKTDIPKDLEIELNKKFSITMSKVRKISKSDTCFHCGKKVSSFCNSHNIPRFCLENIGIDGNVTGPNAIFGLPSMGVSFGKETIGINSSGTFQIICRDCDSALFQDYENSSNYYKDIPPTQKMLAEIAMKNYLKFISKRETEIALYEEFMNVCKRENINSSYYKQKHDVGIKTSRLDLNTYIKGYNRAKKIAKKGDVGFYVIYYKLLDYVVPISIQAPLVISIDLEGNVINNVFNLNTNYTPSDLHLCVFPLESQTAIIMFINDGDKKYRKFYKQFRNLNSDKQLGVINYLIFLYSEDYFLSKNISEKVDLNPFKNVASKMPLVWDTTPVVKAEILKNEFSLNCWNSIPNLLSEEYKLR